MKKFLLPLAIGFAASLAVQYYQNNVSTTSSTNATQSTSETQGVAATNASESVAKSKENNSLALATVVAPWEINSLDPNQTG